MSFRNPSRLRPVRIALALLMVASVFAVVFAFADTLGGITSTTLGADVATVGSCDTDGVNTTYATAYDSTIGAYEVTTVTVSSIGTNGGTTNGLCAGKTMKVELKGASNSGLGGLTVTLANPGTGSDSQADFTSSHINANSVTGVAVTIAG